MTKSQNTKNEQQRDLENKLRHDSNNRNWQLRTENQQLKELLTEIRCKIKTVYDMDQREFITSAVFTNDFVKKIDEVLK